MKNILKACMNWKLLLGIGVAILLAYIFVPQIANYSWILIALICPLSMMFMMAGMKYDRNASKKIFVCPECNLSYGDAEWAKKCATWCKEHKSCPPTPKVTEDPPKLYAKADNLEIIKHAIQY